MAASEAQAAKVGPLLEAARGDALLARDKLAGRFLAILAASKGDVAEQSKHLTRAQEFLTWATEELDALMAELPQSAWPATFGEGDAA